MDCCATEPEARTDSRACPACGHRGRRVKRVTLDALVADGAAPDDQDYRFCATPGCPVAYFGDATGRQVPVSELRVRVGQKETAPDRPLCYCFDYSAADVTAQVEATGTSNIPDVITDHCRRGEDRCPQTNPQGSCCLGNVRAAVGAAERACAERDGEVIR